MTLARGRCFLQRAPTDFQVALVDSAQLGPRPSRLPTHAWATPVVASAEPPSLAPVRESPLSADEHAKLNDVERAGVCSYFVEGAPATITRNIETADGLVNGCDAALHSLTLPDGFDFSEHMARRAVVRDGVTEVELERRRARSTWCRASRRRRGRHCSRAQRVRQRVLHGQ